MRFVGHNLVTLVLVVVIAMPALSPPALLHSHTNGDTSHNHLAAATPSHGYSHSHGPRHNHSSQHSHRVEAKTARHSHDSSAAHSANAPFAHYHVFWFGFTTSLPAPERSDSQRPMADAVEWVPLISETGLPDPIEDGSNFVAVDLATPTGLVRQLPVRHEIRPQSASAMGLLCDTARRKRSGVLVI